MPIDPRIYPWRCPNWVFPTVLAVLACASSASAQEGSPSTGTPGDKPRIVVVPSAPSDSGSTDIVPWLLALGVAVGVIGGGVLAWKVVQRRRESSSGPREQIVPDRGVMLKDYRFHNHLMTGQSSQVWEVVEVSSGRSLAMKILLPKQASNSEARQQLFHEAEAGEELAHPNIIRILKVDRNRYNPNFVMEFFPSGSLKLRIMHKEWDFIREYGQFILKQVATGLAYMNAKGWVHRDVKPDNILVNASGEVRLIDFALAQRVGSGKGIFKRAKCQGTRSYMSPEQIRCMALDGRADIYSFAASAYEMVTGRPPFRANDGNELLRKHLTEKPTSPEIHNPQVTREFSDFVLQMLAKKKEDRPHDFHIVLMKLKNIKVFKGEKAQVKAR
jgi:serine/threonine protein kinase